MRSLRRLAVTTTSLRLAAESLARAGADWEWACVPASTAATANATVVP